jgi:hypothetical protein
VKELTGRDHWDLSDYSGSMYLHQAVHSAGTKKFRVEVMYSRVFTQNPSGC